tara:strand:- start:789 stop:890 length:102 start_codon:yes stop_codon:yes gene_type:complete
LLLVAEVVVDTLVEVVVVVLENLNVNLLQETQL